MPARSTDKPKASIRAFRSVALAASCLSSPFLRATMAVMPTFSAKNIHSCSILGWVGSPTEDSAPAPNPPTIMVSTEPIRLISTISMIDGKAMVIAFRYAVFPSGRSPSRCSSVTRYSGASSRPNNRPSKKIRPPSREILHQTHCTIISRVCKFCVKKKYTLAFSLFFDIIELYS